MDFRPNLFRQFFILISFVAVIVSSTFLVLLWLVPTARATPSDSHSGKLIQTVGNNAPNVLTDTTSITSNVANSAVTLFLPFLDSEGASDSSQLSVAGMTQLYIETNT